MWNIPFENVSNPTGRNEAAVWGWTATAGCWWSTEDWTGGGEEEGSRGREGGKRHTLEKVLFNSIVILTVKQFLLVLDQFLKLGHGISPSQLLGNMLRSRNVVTAFQRLLRCQFTSSAGCRNCHWNLFVTKYVKLLNLKFRAIITDIVLSFLNPLRLQYVILRTQFQSRCDYDT